LKLQVEDNTILTGILLICYLANTLSINVFCFIFYFLESAVGGGFESKIWELKCKGGKEGAMRATSPLAKYQGFVCFV
jgi:hypothetical protein